MSLQYKGFIRINGVGCQHLRISLDKDAVPHTFDTTAEAIDAFVAAVGNLVPGVTEATSALEKRAKAKLLIDLSYYRAEGQPLPALENVELEVV